MHTAKKQTEKDVDLNEGNIRGAKAYVRRMRNKGKKEYGGVYLAWLTSGERGEEPYYKDYGLSYMGGQSVRMGLDEFGFAAMMKERG
jgi:hypothetical protein